MPGSTNLISVFPVFGTVLGIRGDWFQSFATKLVHPAFLLMTLMLVLWVGLMALKRFDEADLDRKVWNIPVLTTVITFWPFVVMGLKELVDTFNTFLIVDIFKIPWRGFGFPEFGTLTQIEGWPAESLARLLPNLGYWIIYSFFVIFFFFYSVLGPFILAKGVLSDEMENFFELLKEFVNLLLWQSTLVILVAFIMPDIVSGQPLPPQPPTNFYFMSIILGVMLLFVPTLTRKFVRHLEGAFVPLGFRWGGAMLGFAAATRLGGVTLASAGVRAPESLREVTHRLSRLEEFRTRMSHRRQIERNAVRRQELEEQLHRDRVDEEKAKEEADNVPIVEMFKRAQREIEEEGGD